MSKNIYRYLFQPTFFPLSFTLGEIRVLSGRAAEYAAAKIAKEHLHPNSCKFKGILKTDSFGFEPDIIVP